MLSKLLSSEAYTPVNKFLAKKLGFIVAGYFGELIRQRERFGEEEFYFSQKQMIDELGISEHEQRIAVKKLTEIGFIETSKKGMPAKYYFKIQDITVLEFFKDQSSKISSTSALNFKGHSNNTIIKNNNKINNTNVLVEEQVPLYGKEEINFILALIKKYNNGIIDGAVSEQRRYGKLLFGKLEELDSVKKGKYKYLDILEIILKIISTNTYHSHKISSPKILYYNLSGLMQICKQELDRQKQSEMPFIPTL